jgi:hypothetical protein
VPWTSRWRNEPSDPRTPAGRAYLDLQNRARAESRGTQELLTLYVVERWLARLAAPPCADEFVLKGGSLVPRRWTAATLARPLRAVRSWGPALTVSPGSVADSESAFLPMALAQICVTP